MDNDRINYSDLVSPDDSIKNLIDQLTELNKTYGAAMDAIKTGAKDIISQLKAMSTATAEGRNHIDEAAQSANRLTRAQKELRFAMSDVGKEVAWLKSQTASHNRMSVEARKESLALIGSYDKLKAQLRDQIRLWKSLSETKRNESFGKTLLSGIMNTKTQLAELDGQLRIHVQSLSAVEKAEQKLNFLRSAEGKRLMELKRLINEELLTNKANARALDEVTQARIRYNQAQTAARQQAHELNILAHEANRVSKLQAQLNLSAAGSYNRLAAQYELNKIKLNAMSAAERSGTEAGKQLEEQTLELYVQMQKLQEATGNHRLSVGDYAKSWDGLGFQVSQVVRELPAAAISLNTLFIALSNNIPMLVDEINAVRESNKKAAAEGEPTKDVIGSIVEALFSWQSALILGMTLLSAYGDQIADWIVKLVKGKKESLRFSQALEDVNKEIANTNAGFGNNVTTLKKLAREWSNLKDSSAAKRNQWIKDSKEEFDKLEISINNVNDAENVFVQNTQAMLDAFKFRAKAAAAIKLATDKYEQALVKEAELESEKRKNASFSDQLLGAFASTNFQSPTNYRYSAQDARNMEKATEAARKKRLLGIKAEMEALNKEGDLYFSIYELQKRLEEKTLEGAGIEKKHKDDRERHPRLVDLTDIIWRNDLAIRKKYELSLSALQRDEFKKRRIEAVDQTNQTIRAMQDKFRKNEVYLANPEGKYKPLTPELKAMIENQQKEIASIIENTQRKLEIDLVNLQYELEIDKNRRLRQVMNWHLEDVADNIEKEKQMRLAQISEEESMYTTKGSTVDGEVVITSTATPEQTAAFQRKKQQIIAEYDQIIYEMRARDIEAQLELVRKGSEEELALLEKQNEIAMQLALTQNRAKPIEERQSEEDIIAGYGKKHKQAVGTWKMDNLEAKQNRMLAEYEAEKHNAYNVALYKLKLEKQFWAEHIKLAEEGAIDVSEAELDAWRANQKKREREYKEQSSFMNLVGQEGLSGAIFTKLDWDEDKIKAADAFTEAVVSNLKAIADAEVEVAEAAVEAAEKRVEAAQTAYEAEVEGRNNGYANSVATAKKELQQEKKNQQQKQKLLEEAQRRQQAIDTLTQTSSLITASAQLWSSFSGMGPAGPALALAAIAAMWGSFAVAKVKAAQVTKASSQEYGEGGLEFLEGGSHASGNDIDLHTTNSKGKNMRAEGGEAMAIINRRNTRKYRKVLPQIVDSINKGTFEDKFIGAFKTGDDLSQNITYQSQAVDLSRLEEDVRALKDNSERQYYAMPDGSYIEKRRNVIRRIH